MANCKGCGFDMSRVAMPFLSYLCSRSCWYQWTYKIQSKINNAIREAA